MTNEAAQSNRPRSLEDRLISGAHALRFGMTEPLKLRLARMRHGGEYDTRDESPLVSVCLPTYNRAQLLIDRAVSSVLAQTYKNLELVIVGHHCTDNTSEVLSKITDPRVRFYNMPHRTRRYQVSVENHWFVGGAEPANVAIDMARGKWLARIDDDDIWTPDHLEVLLRFAQQEQKEFVSASYIAERHGQQVVVDVKDDHPRIGGVQTWLYRSYLRFFKYNTDCWRKSWNRVWDTDKQDRMYRAGVTMGFLDHVVAYILPRPGEVTIGLDAYRLTAQQKLEHYKFDEEQSG